MSTGFWMAFSCGGVIGSIVGYTFRALTKKEVE